MHLFAKWCIYAVLQKIGEGIKGIIGSSIPSAPAKDKSINTLFAGFFVLLKKLKSWLLVTTSSEIMELFKSLNEQGRTVVIVTHDPKVAEQCRRVIEISDGEIVGGNE